MSVTTLQQPGSLRLSPYAVAVPALASRVRPALVLAERQARALLDSASRQDVGRGGCFAAGPAGIQVWTGPFDGPGGTKGSAIHLGSVDWTWNTPVKHYATIYRAMVTESGVEHGETTTSILARVLALAGVAIDGHRLELPLPPPRDPFRHGLPADGEDG